MGFEYARLVHSSFWDKRPSPNWYGNPLFDYSSYDSRRWAAHSGSDSDDLYLYFGYQSNRLHFMPALNFERHGVLYNRPAEVKMEIRLDFRYKWGNYWLNILIADDLKERNKRLKKFEDFVDIDEMDDEYKLEINLREQMKLDVE